MSSFPLVHVRQILLRLALPEARFESIMTPHDVVGEIDSPSTTSSQFWTRVVERYPLREHDVVLIGGSLCIEAARSVGVRAIHVDSSIKLEDALLKYLDIHPGEAIGDATSYRIMHSLDTQCPLIRVTSLSSMKLSICERRTRSISSPSVAQ